MLEFIQLIIYYSVIITIGEIVMSCYIILWAWIYITCHCYWSLKVESDGNINFSVENNNNFKTKCNNST